LAGNARLLPDGLMIAGALLPLSGPITWMPECLDVVERQGVASYELGLGGGASLWGSGRLPGRCRLV
jgi:hypothetical protein